MSQLTLPEPTPGTDRGQCQGLNTETMKRCAGRMVATYVETSHALTAYSVWVCSVCGGKMVP